MIDALLKQAKEYQLTENIFDFNGILMQPECKLFTDIQFEHHNLHRHLPNIKTGCHALQEL